MKIARLHSFNDIRIEEIPEPEVAPDEALVKVKASGICSGDVMPWYIEKKAPVVIGHEAAGEIAKVGGNVTSFRKGDRVFAHHHAPCMGCSFCKRGDFVQCVEWRKTGINPGGIAEYILVNEGILKHDTLVLPHTVSYEDATLIEPAACVIKSLNRSGIKKDDTILIIGLGVMGMMHIFLSREYGAQTIIGADMVHFRLKKAIHLGADAVVDINKKSLKEQVLSITGGKGAEIVIVGPNSVDAMNKGLQCVAPGGTVVFFTPAKPDETLSIDPNYLYFNDIQIVSSYSCGPEDTRRALEFVKRRIIAAERLVTHRFKIDEADKAYKTVAEANESLKVLVVFD